MIHPIISSRTELKDVLSVLCYSVVFFVAENTVVFWLTEASQTESKDVLLITCCSIAFCVALDIFALSCFPSYIQQGRVITIMILSTVDENIMFWKTSKTSFPQAWCFKFAGEKGIREWTEMEFGAYFFETEQNWYGNQPEGYPK